MLGKIISIDSNKGFVKSENKTYYFNKKSFKNENDFLKLKINDYIQFDEIATSKGMNAINCFKLDTFNGYEKHNNLYITGLHKNSDKDFKIEGSIIISKWHKSPEDAKQDIINVAKKLNLNYICFNPILKREFNEGNYIYSMHAAKAFIGISGKPKVFLNKLEAQKSIENIEEDYKNISLTLKKEIEYLNDERLSQESIFNYIYILIKRFFKLFT
jgi:hypothetical protein